jgi:hypothetical protein
MGWTLDVAPLDLIGGLGGQDVDREGNFEEDVAFGPGNLCFYI